MATTRERPDPTVLTQEAKHPVTVAAGPYGHPFHPILVTLPIGTWIASLVFDVATRAQDAGSPSLVDASYWLIGLGIVGALVAAVFGLLDLLPIARGTRAFRNGLIHLGLNLLVVALFAVNFAWRSGDHTELAKVEVGQIALSVVAIVLLAISGWIGGRLAYRYGVRVVDERAQAEGFR
jgi:uncharacterized membrane protein